MSLLRTHETKKKEKKNSSELNSLASLIFCPLAMCRSHNIFVDPDECENEKGDASNVRNSPQDPRFTNEQHNFSSILGAKYFLVFFFANISRAQNEAVARKERDIFAVTYRSSSMESNGFGPNSCCFPCTVNSYNINLPVVLVAGWLSVRIHAAGPPNSYSPFV